MTVFQKLLVVLLVTGLIVMVQYGIFQIGLAFKKER